MMDTRARIMFVNLAVRDLTKSMMYGRSFYDLDGHHWEVMWIEPQVGSGEGHRVQSR